MKNFFNTLFNYISENRMFISGFLWGMCIMSFISVYQSITEMHDAIEKMNANIEKMEALNGKSTIDKSN